MPKATHSTKWVLSDSRYYDITDKILRFVDNHIFEQTRCEVTCAIEDELRTIVYQHNYRPVLKKISAIFRSVMMSVIGKINGEIFRKVPIFPELERQALLREVRKRLFTICHSHILHLRVVTFRQFSEWLIVEQERIQSLRCFTPFWYETDASSKAGLRDQVESVYERLYDALEGNLLPKIGNAVKAYLQELEENSRHRSCYS